MCQTCPAAFEEKQQQQQNLVDKGLVSLSTWPN